MEKDFESTSNIQLQLQRNCQRMMLSLDYLRQEEKMCDIAILIDKAQIKAHKIILSAGSLYFRDQIEKDNLKKNSEFDIDVFILDSDFSISVSDMQLLVRFLYTGFLQINNDNLDHLSYLSKILDIPLMKNLCIEFRDKNEKRHKDKLNKPKEKEIVVATNQIETMEIGESVNCHSLNTNDLIQINEDNEIVISSNNVESAQTEGKHLKLTFTNGETTFVAIDQDDDDECLSEAKPIIGDAKDVKSYVILEDNVVADNLIVSENSPKNILNFKTEGINQLISAAETLQEETSSRKRRKESVTKRSTKAKVQQEIEEEPDDYNTEDEENNVTIIHEEDVEADIINIPQRSTKETKIFPCELCAFTVSSRADLARHMDSKHNGYVNDKGDQIHRCQNCGRMFVTLDELIIHGYMCLMQRVPGKMNRFKCPSCQYEIEKQRSAEHHYQRSHADIKRACPDCSEENVVVEYYLEHRMLKHDLDVELLGFTVYCCPYCNFRTTRHQFKRRHVKKCKPEKHYIHRSLDPSGEARSLLKKTVQPKPKRPNKKTVAPKQKPENEARNWKQKHEECNNCGEIIVGFAAMLKHVLEKHPTIPVYCELCRQPFLNEIDLLVHDKRCRAIQIANSNMFGCSKCEYKTYKARKIAEHFRIRHTDDVLMCPVCSYSCKYMLNMLQHVINDHDVQLKDKKVYQCEHCSYKTVRVEHFRKHSDQHEGVDRRVSCSICFKTFATNATLDAHIKNVHVRVKSFQCPKCEFCSHSAASLRNHLYTAHKVVPERQDGLYDQVYKCAHCDYSHIYERIVCRHINLKHSNQSQNRNENDEEFEQEQQFSCVFCNEMFASLEEAETHQASIHRDILEEDDENVSMCNVCGFKTNSDEVLADHFATKHSNVTHVVLDDDGLKEENQNNITILSAQQIESDQQNDIIIVNVNDI